MPQNDEDLRDALFELDRLRKREIVRRRESESLLLALRVLADDSDDVNLPIKMLDCLKELFELDEAAIILDVGPATSELASYRIQPIQAVPEGADFVMWRTLPAFPKYLSKAPRIIGDSSEVPGLQNRPGGTGSYLVGTISVSGAKALLALFRSKEQPRFKQDDLNLFLRILPMVEQASKRQKERAVRERLESELRDRQKMESLGTLAGGIAHEINTPLQYIMNNLSYLADASSQLLDFSKVARRSVSGTPEELATANDALSAEWERIDGEFLETDLPEALEQSMVGLEKISKIVQAIREFSHPSGDSNGEIDINREIETALTVANNQWKYVADVETDLATGLPLVEGASDNVRQILINLLINATHAIEDRMKEGASERGQIRVATSTLGKSAVITVRDNGTGMSEEVRTRAFDPFFTTKAPGRGTGQGLALCYKMVVQNLGGRIDIDSQLGSGTSVQITLPVRKRTALVA